MRSFLRIHAALPVIIFVAQLHSYALGAPAPSMGESGYLLIPSFNNHTVFRYDAVTGDFVDDFVPARSGGLNEPWATVFSPYDGSLLVSAGHFIPGQFIGVLRYDGATGNFLGPFTPKITMAHAVTFGPDGNVYVGDRLGEGQGLIRRFDGLTGEYRDEFVAEGSGGLSHPLAHVFGPSGSNPRRLDLYVSDEATGNVLRYNGMTGEFVSIFVPSGSGGLLEPFGMIFGPDGNLYVADTGLIGGARGILRFQGPKGRSPGAFVDAFVPSGSGGLLEPLGLLFGPDANGDGHQDLYVNSQLINPKSFLTVRGTSSVKVYDGVTGDYIRDFIPVELNGGLEGPGLMTFSYSDPVTLEYLGP